MKINRYLEGPIRSWLDTRMVFLGGPRQVGKTFLAKSYLKSNGAYFTWDDLKDRAIIKSHNLPNEHHTLVLDELHKYPRWRTLLKGYFDKKEVKPQIIVTGSARLDLFRKGGDSLFGRYHYLRLHPLSLPEVKKSSKTDPLRDLLEFGGFPEPFLKKDVAFAKIWRRERVARVIQQDLRDLTTLRDYTKLELLADLLPSKVGSLLSIQSLAEDLENSPNTIVHWLSILESVYLCYRIAPFGSPKIKAIKKQNKLFLWDWASVETLGARFENLVASHLLKYCHYIEDTQGDQMELRFLRDQYGREVDFVVLKNKKPIFAVECKSGEKQLSPHIEYFKDRTNIPRFYQVHLGASDWQPYSNVYVLPFVNFCKLEKLV